MPNILSVWVLGKLRNIILHGCFYQVGVNWRHVHSGKEVSIHVVDSCNVVYVCCVVEQVLRLIWQEVAVDHRGQDQIEYNGIWEGQTHTFNYISLCVCVCETGPLRKVAHFFQTWDWHAAAAFGFLNTAICSWKKKNPACVKCRPYYQVKTASWEFRPLLASLDPPSSDRLPSCDQWGTRPSRQPRERISCLLSTCATCKSPVSEQMWRTCLANFWGFLLIAQGQRATPLWEMALLINPLLWGVRVCCVETKVLWLVITPTHLTQTKLAKQLERTCHLEANTCSACRFSKQCDVLWVPTEWADIPVHPGNGSLLVPQAIVSCQNSNIQQPPFNFTSRSVRF